MQTVFNKIEGFGQSEVRLAEVLLFGILPKVILPKDNIIGRI